MSKIDITKVDKNLTAPEIGNVEIAFFDVRNQPFALEGLPWFEENGSIFYRLHKRLTQEETNEGVMILTNHTSGVCVRFRSNSPAVILRTRLAFSSDMNHMPRTGSSGFDSYCRETGGNYIYNTTFPPCSGQTDAEVLIGKNPDGKMLDWLINFPLYGGAESVEIGLVKGSVLETAAPHRVEKPILFYGSSITQGGCASRPGNAYPAMLCRTVDAPLINLGFSGSARGEEAIARAIAELDLSVFVYDYDYNAPDADHLERTHEKFFRIIRQKRPDLPVIMLSKCDYRDNNDYNRRREIIRTTFRHARETGDRKVFFIDGETLFGRDMRDGCTVDGCHPNDLGFYRMYENILPTLLQALEI